MKQVQVFKKTLLSVAVVTALGGYGTLSLALEPYQIITSKLNSAASLNNPIAYLERLEDSENKYASVISNLKNRQKEMRVKEGERRALNKTKLADNATDAEKKEHAAKIKKAEEAVKAAKAEFIKEAARHKQYYTVVSDDGTPVTTPAGKTGKAEAAKPGAKTAAKTAAKTTTAKTAAKTAGKAAAKTDAAAKVSEKAAQRVAAVQLPAADSDDITRLPTYQISAPGAADAVVTRASLDSAAAESVDKVKGLFRENGSATGNPVKHVRLDGMDARDAAKAEDITAKIAKGETISFDENTGAVTFQYHVLESSSGSVNSEATKIQDVRGQAKTAGNGVDASDPSGAYVVSGQGTALYHGSIGEALNLEQVVVKDDAVAKVAETVSAQKVVVSNATLTGYTVDGDSDTPALVTINGRTPVNRNVQSDGTLKGGDPDANTVSQHRSSMEVAGSNGLVRANLHGVEELSLSDGATLLTDKVNETSTAKLGSLVLNGKVTLSKFTPTASTIYGESELQVEIGEGQTVIQDINGFKSVTLSGGVLEGDLTGSSDEDGGLMVVLTSGTYKGGVVGTVNSVIIDGGVQLKPGTTVLQSKTDDEFNSTSLDAVEISAPVVVASGGNPAIHKVYDNNAELKATTVTSNEGVVLQSGAKLTFVLDHGVIDADKRADAHLTVNGPLTAEGGNMVLGSFQSAGDSQQSSYEAKKALYQASRSTSPAAADTSFTVIRAAGGIIDSENLTAGSTDPFFALTGSVDDDENPTEYLLTPSYNQKPAAALKSMGLTDNDAQVAIAAQVSAFEADPSIAPAQSSTEALTTGAKMDKTIADAGPQKTADMNQWDPNYGAGMAAVSVQQKATQSISRHLNAGRTGISTGDMFESQGFWGEYFHSSGEMDKKDGVRGFENKVNGITLGLDAMLNEQVTVGFAFTYGDIKSETKDAGRDISGDAYMGTLYSGWMQDNFFFDGMLSYGVSKNDYKRKAGSFGSYKSSADDTVWSARFVGGYNHQVNEWVVQPQVEFNYVNVKFDDFTEKGAGNFAEKVKMNDFQVMELGAGVKLLAEYDTGNGVLKPELTLMGYHDFKDTKAEVEGPFIVGGQRYVVTGPERDQNRFLAGVGLNYTLDNNLTLGLNYDYNWLGDYKAHGLVASIRYDF